MVVVVFDFCGLSLTSNICNCALHFSNHMITALYSAVPQKSTRRAENEQKISSDGSMFPSLYSAIS